MKKFFRSQKSVKISWYSEIWNTKSWDTFAFLGRFPTYTSPTPPLTPQTILDSCIQNLFEFQLCIGWGRENCKTFSKRMHLFKREPRNEYCSTVKQECVLYTLSGLVTTCRCEFYSLVSIIFMSNRKWETTTHDFIHKTTQHEFQFWFLLHPFYCNLSIYSHSGLSQNRSLARGTENIFSEDNLRSRIFGSFVVKFLARLPLLGFSNI